ncbi:MAG: hypothetical protein ACAI35_16010 [Candidatus Methylacidiphilales bacterium]
MKLKSTVLTSAVILGLSALATTASIAKPLPHNLAAPVSANQSHALYSGFLKVYSATNEYDDSDIYFYPHSDYTIYSTDGKVVKNVRNSESGRDEEPASITLPEGRYMVSADSDNNGRVMVAVLVKGGQETVVKLDGNSDSKHKVSKAPPVTRSANHAEKSKAKVKMPDWSGLPNF